MYNEFPACGCTCYSHNFIFSIMYLFWTILLVYCAKSYSSPAAIGRLSIDNERQLEKIEQIKPFVGNEIDQLNPKETQIKAKKVKPIQKPAIRIPFVPTRKHIYRVPQPPFPIFEDPPSGLADDMKHSHSTAADDSLRAQRRAFIAMLESNRRNRKRSKHVVTDRYIFLTVLQLDLNSFEKAQVSKRFPSNFYRTTFHFEFIFMQYEYPSRISSFQSSTSQTLTQPLTNEPNPLTSKTSSARKPRKTDSSSNRKPDVVTILNDLHPDFFIPYRQMGWNMFDTIRTMSPFIYRINDGSSNNIILKKVCEERGWHEYEENWKERVNRLINPDSAENSHWNLWWSYNFFNHSPYRTLKCWQYTNHNPKAFQFCSKSYLSRFLRKMRTEFGEMYNFSPKTFVMPEDYVRFVTEHTKRQEKECPEAQNIADSELIPISVQESSSKSLDGRKNSITKYKEFRQPVWIVKPIGKSQGKGIVLTKDIGSVVNAHRCVVQEYITRPLLIAGYKWDIRIYVCIASTDPLVIYLYREGLCRFATEKFDLSNLSSIYSHLTNSSLNKLAPDYAKDKEIIGCGCKWSLKQLRSYFKKVGIRDWLMWQKVMSLVVLTVVGEGLKSGYMFPANRNCFDFFGFDILIDRNLEPWLLEVNYSPGLGGDCNVDELVKVGMLNELFDLMGFPNNNKSIARNSGKGEKGKLPTSSGSIFTPITSPQAQHKDKTRLPSSKKLTLDCVNVDISCKARLKEAALIYSQDLVLEFFGNNCRNPNFRLTPTMKILYERKLAHQRRRKAFERQTKKKLKQEKKEEIQDKKEDIPPINHEQNNNSEQSSEEANLDINNNVKEDESRPTSTTSVTTNNSSSEESISQNSEDTDSSKYIYIQRQDWSEAPLHCGNWCLVYPCKAVPYRSPYRSALADLRNVVQIMDQYLTTATSLVNALPEQSDELYESRITALKSWNIEIWAPPKGDEDEETILP